MYKNVKLCNKLTHYKYTNGSVRFIERKVDVDSFSRRSRNSRQIVWTKLLGLEKLKQYS